eukprot:TRINITY_DN2585_c1_g4_i2.p1 TRINITY_DN2585_c1_g4~~TRINITY_DN2585_c1_g4_i2.p1  ORF type:complete len:351 (+),score=150.39 TRINITY_DN2585_c1_g4_i2:2-1054(+)
MLVYLNQSSNEETIENGNNIKSINEKMNQNHNQNNYENYIKQSIIKLEQLANEQLTNEQTNNNTQINWFDFYENYNENKRLSKVIRKSFEQEFKNQQIETNNNNNNNKINKLNSIKIEFEVKSSQSSFDNQEFETNLSKTIIDENKNNNSSIDIKNPNLNFDLNKLTQMKRQPPANWIKVWNGILEMRKKIDAPVDSCGCSKLPQQTLSPSTYKFQILVSLMLSSQTKDPVTAAAVQRLQQYSNGLTIDSLLDLPENKIAELIKPVSFYKRKATYLKNTAKIIKEKFAGDPPEELDEVMKFPGVGPKMSYLYLQEACNKVLGIGVDVHVHRISNRLGWVKSNTPEETRKV